MPRSRPWSWPSPPTTASPAGANASPRARRRSSTPPSPTSCGHPSTTATLTTSRAADVNSAYDAATAIKVCHEIARYDLAFIEEPVSPDDIDGYELIRRSQPIPLAGGESEFGIFGFRELLKRRALDIVQPDVARIGGFTAAKRRGALVHAHHVKYAPHTRVSRGVGQHCSRPVAAAGP